MRIHRKSFLKGVLRLVALLSLAIFTAVPARTQTLTPAVVSSRSYINGTPLTAHTTAAFNSGGASTLVAFVSANTPWLNQPVSVSSLSDNAGNTWNLLTGPTTWVGGSFTLVSAIKDPGAGGVSADVTTAPITVPDNTLLLGWAKNESGATATALDGYTLDAVQSTSYLWAESQTALAAGSYTGHFQYSGAIGWQTAVVGLKAPAGPAAFSQTVTTN